MLLRLGITRPSKRLVIGVRTVAIALPGIGIIVLMFALIAGRILFQSFIVAGHKIFLMSLLMTRLDGEIGKKLDEQGKWIHGKLKEMADSASSPHEVALGFAIGLFTALATPGIDLLVALLLVLVFKLHRLAVLFGVAIIDNPLSLAVIYPSSFQLGKMIIGYEPVTTDGFFSLHNLLNISKPLFVGNILIASVLALVSYFIVYNIYYYWHYRKIEKKLQ